MHISDWSSDVCSSDLNEEESAFEHLPPAQIIIHQKAPFTDHLLRRLRKAVPRHVDKTEQERIANVEEIQLLRTPRRVRGARQSIPSRKSVQERTFADIGAAGESDFLYIRVWQEFQVRCGFQEGYRTGEYLSRRVHSFNILDRKSTRLN